MKSRTVKVNLIIHLFAAAHALATVGLRYFGIADDILLTALTIVMVIMVARTCGFPLDIAAALALLSCFAGFYMGVKGADLISRLSGGKLSWFSNVITTFAVTEILGWTTYFIARRKRSSPLERSTVEDA